MLLVDTQVMAVFTCTFLILEIVDCCKSIVLIFKDHLLPLKIYQGVLTFLKKNFIMDVKKVVSLLDPKPMVFNKNLWVRIITINKTKYFNFTHK